MDWQTEETLFYLQSLDYCKGDEYTVLLVNKDNQIINTFKFIKKPIYITSFDTESSPQWRDLVIWSDGSYRLVQHNGNVYPSNLSLPPTISEQDILWSPEKYFLVMP
jgi:hypothetical protein